MAAQTPGTISSNTLATEEYRRHSRIYAAEGIRLSGDMAVTQNGTPNMSVNVAAGEAFVLGDESTAQGNYYGRNDATVNVAITTANATNPRDDIIIARHRDDDYSGASNDFTIVAIAGTPAASPVEPALPSNALKLAVVRVGAAVTSITTANITDARYRSATELAQVLADTATGVSITTALTNILASVTMTLPTGWVEMDCYVDATVRLDNTSNTEARRATLYMESPAATTLKEYSHTVFHLPSSNATSTVHLHTIITGLTANRTFQLRGLSTLGTTGTISANERYITVRKVRRA